MNLSIGVTLRRFVADSVDQAVVSFYKGDDAVACFSVDLDREKSTNVMIQMRALARQWSHEQLNTYWHSTDVSVVVYAEYGYEALLGAISDAALRGDESPAYMMPPEDCQLSETAILARYLSPETLRKLRTLQGDEKAIIDAAIAGELDWLDDEAVEETAQQHLDRINRNAKEILRVSGERD